MPWSRRFRGDKAWPPRPWWRDQVLRPRVRGPPASGFPCHVGICAISKPCSPGTCGSWSRACGAAMPRVRRRPGRPRHRAGRYPSAAAQRQALGADQAGGAHGDRGGRLPAGFVNLHTDREPLVGIKGAARAAGVPDNPHPQRPIGAGDGHQRIRWPATGPVHGRCRPVIPGAGVRQTAICFLPPQNLRYSAIPRRQRTSHASLASRQAPVLPSRPDQHAGLRPRARPANGIPRGPASRLAPESSTWQPLLR
jgi:hypothetical protein